LRLAIRLILQSARDEVISAGSDNHLAPRRPLQIFHITAIPNLVGIGKVEKVIRKRGATKKKMQHENIAYQGAQGKRATKLVAQSPGGVIHDYVPFYFAQGPQC